MIHSLKARVTLEMVEPGSLLQLTDHIMGDEVLALIGTGADMMTIWFDAPRLAMVMMPQGRIA